MSPNEVDENRVNAPAGMQKKLKTLRALIKQIVPDAQGKISYGMSFYAYKGRLVDFVLMKNHIGLYIPPPIIEQYTVELKNYGTTKSAMHSPRTGELPKHVITKLVTVQV
jgi:uncharacterized protein YdhG (YjbR/CyaY superfamily)